MASFRVEAEAFSIVQGFKTSGNGAASSGRQLQAGSKGTQIADHVFAGNSGIYDLTLGYFDESDGVSHLEIFVNDTLVDEFSFDSNEGTATASRASAAERTISGISLSPGDTIRLQGERDGGEPLRLDYLDFGRAGSVRIEAEDFDTLRGYVVKSNTHASEAALIRTNKAGSGTASTAFTGEAGNYDLSVGYFDENDGVSTGSIAINGHVIDAWSFSATDGGPIANANSRATREAGTVYLEPGDMITLAGTQDGGEPARFDYVELAPTDTSLGTEPTLDILTFDPTGETGLQVLLGDGAGGFEPGERIARDISGFVAVLGDLNGDGYLDIATRDYYRSPIFEIALNDGTGGFGEPVVYDLSAYVEQIDNIAFGDIDGDGDLDVFVSNEYSNHFFLNDGNSIFSYGFPFVDFLLYVNSQDTVMADFNGDNNLDIALRNDIDRVSLLLGDGQVPPSFTLFDDPRTEANPSFEVADFNSDGYLDFLLWVEEEGDSFVDFHLYDPVSNSMPGYLVRHEPGNRITEAIAIADFDGDGDQDIVAWESNDSSESDDNFIRHELFLKKNSIVDGVPTLTASLITNELPPSKILRAGDIDNDGDFDLILANASDPSSAIRTLLNDGSGNFSEGPVTEFDSIGWFRAARDAVPYLVAHLDERVEPNSVPDPTDLLV